MLKEERIRELEEEKALEEMIDAKRRKDEGESDDKNKNPYDSDDDKYKHIKDPAV